MAINTGYPYDGFEDQYPETAPQPEWIGFGHKHLVFHRNPIKHIVLADGQHHSEIDLVDPDQPLDGIVADQLRGQPAERPHFPVSRVLSRVPTERAGAREGMEYGQFHQPDTRPGVILHHLWGQQAQAAEPNTRKKGR